MIGMCGDPVRSACSQLASYLEGSPLMWIVLLHLLISLNADDDDYDDERYGRCHSTAFYGFSVINDFEKRSQK